jgi:hypothetical protein
MAREIEVKVRKLMFPGRDIPPEKPAKRAALSAALPPSEEGILSVPEDSAASADGPEPLLASEPPVSYGAPVPSAPPVTSAAPLVPEPPAAQKPPLTPEPALSPVPPAEPRPQRPAPAQAAPRPSPAQTLPKAPPSRPAPAAPVPAPTPRPRGRPPLDPAVRAARLAQKPDDGLF